METSAARGAAEAQTWWEQERRSTSGLGGGLNIAHEAVDRHVIDGLGSNVAIRWIPKSGPRVDLTYGDLSERTDRFARILSEFDSDRPPRVATLLGRVTPLYVAALGTLKAGGVYAPLFSAFGPDPVAVRLQIGEIDVLVTTERQYRAKVLPKRPELPFLQHILLVDGHAASFEDPAVVDLQALLDAASPGFTIAPTPVDQPALLHFTSGTTGRPKGALHVHEAVVAHGSTGRTVLGLRPGLTYWCTADPGWVTGTSYGIVAPLVNGATSIIDESEFDAERWYRLIETERIEVLYTSPTALRLLKRVGDAIPSEFDLTSVEVVASVGEPLDPEALLWARRIFGCPVLDTWWQTETGAIMIANTTDTDVRPGSMGQALPGIEATLLACDSEGELILDDAGRPEQVNEADSVGEIALRPGWPSMFRAYLGQPAKYDSCFVDGWYRAGDLARRDPDGYFWFVGRNNDLIKSSGHLIGPFEVESALTEHPAVIEAGVIGKPDETMGAIVKAFVVLSPEATPDEETVRDIRGHARQRLGPAVAPREIEVVESLPHTRSGKIMRRVLKARELGLDEGDTSTLETP